MVKFFKSINRSAWILVAAAGVLVVSLLVDFQLSLIVLGIGLGAFLLNLENRPRWWSLAIAVGIFVYFQVLISIGLMNDFWSTLIRQGAVMAIVALGLNLIYGFNGQFSLGQYGFYAIGAYASADVTYRWAQMHTANGLTVVLCIVLLVGVAILFLRQALARVRGLDTLSAFGLYLVLAIAAGAVAVYIGGALAGPVTALLQALPSAVSVQIVFFLSVLLGGLLTAEVAFLFGLPVLTLGSDYFGIATLGLTIIVKVLFDNSDTMFGFEEMKGARGMVGIPQMTSWFWVFLFLLVIVVLTRNLLHSSYGRAIISVREDEIASKSMGINIADFKILTFVLGSAFGGLAGGLYAHVSGFLVPGNFDFIKSFDPMIIVVFGGLGSVTGTLGAAFAWSLVLEGVLRLVLPPGFETWRYVVYPILLLVMMLLKPSGLFGNFELPYLRQIMPALRLKNDKTPAGAPGGKV
jgi:branched-chain amino acid transport system permease protein